MKTHPCTQCKFGDSNVFFFKLVLIARGTKHSLFCRLLIIEFSSFFKFQIFMSKVMSKILHRHSIVFHHKVKTVKRAAWLAFPGKNNHGEKIHGT